MKVLTVIPSDLDALLDYNHTSFFQNDDYGDEDGENPALYVKIPYGEESFAVGEFQGKLEERHGGEDQGSAYYSIYSFTKGDEVVYVKFDGWYQSYNGSEFESYFVVVPEQKVTTEFKRPQ